MNRLTQFIIFTCLFYGSCNSPFKDRPFSDYRIDSLQLDSHEKAFQMTDGRDFITRITLDSMDHTAYIYLYDLTHHSMHKARLANGRQETAFQLNQLHDEELYTFDICDNYFYFSTNGKLLRTDTLGKVTTYNICRQIDDRYYTYAYRNELGLNINVDSTFYQLMMSKGLDQDAPDWIKQRASLPCVGKFRLQGDSIYCADSIAYFPEDYKRNFHYEIMPSCAFANGKFHYLFGTGDSIYTFDPKTRTTYNVASIRSIDPDYKPFAFDRDSVSSINYLYKFAVTSPTVRIFLYDSYRKVYYLGIKKAQNYLADDGVHVNDVFDFPFRISVLDSNFKKLHAVDFPQGRFAALYQAFVGPKGLYLMLAKRKSITYEIYDLTRGIGH